MAATYDHLKGFFSRDYKTARQRFLQAATAGGASMHQLPLADTDPEGNRLGIDIAWFGHPQPRRALVHVSGIHGVEGFAGSAVQLAVLDRPPILPPDGALILVHVFNPYGMSWLRRVNGNNIDLNRNFLFGSNDWHGAPHGYAILNDFLNPPRPPSRFNFFYSRLLLAAAGLGRSAIRQAVAGGQYQYPKGIFYGGNELEPESAQYIEWLASHLGEVRRVFVIDVHTGLGRYGKQTLLLRSPAVRVEELSNNLRLPVATPDVETNVMGYGHHGGHSSAVQQILPKASQVCLTQEFGTYHGPRLLRALRAENQHHHFGNGRTDHWSKSLLKKMFCPDSPAWRRQVAEQGCHLVHRAATLLTTAD